MPVVDFEKLLKRYRVKKVIVIVASIVVGLLVLIIGGIFDNGLPFFDNSVSISASETGVYYLYTDSYERDEHSDELLKERDRHFVKVDYLSSKNVTVREFDEGVSIQTPSERCLITEEGELYVGFDKKEETVELKRLGGELYVSMADILATDCLKDVAIDFDMSEHYVVYRNAGYDYTTAVLVKDSPVYGTPESYDEYLREKAKGKTATSNVRGIVGEKGVLGYFYSETIDDNEYTYFFSESPRLSGYVDVDLLSDITEVRPTEIVAPREGDKLVMVWEAIYVETVDTSEIGAMEGLNAVSPTWYTLDDAEGAVRNIVDPKYITWARERGYAMYPLVTNDSEIDRTSEFLASYSSQIKFINALVDEALAQGYEGYNLDFEHIYLEDRDAYSHFVNMLCFEMHKWGLTVSVDVNVMDGADNWSKCFDHKVLGTVADLLVVMAYDEHHPTSKVAGSNASYSWVEYNLKKIAEIVPAEKIVLGVPFYTRIWYTDDSGVSCEVLSMYGTQEFLARGSFDIEWDEKAKQRKATGRSDEKLTEIWIEDADSLTAKVEFAKKMNFAGVAAWRRGFESDEAWGAINLNN